MSLSLVKDGVAEEITEDFERYDSREEFLRDLALLKDLDLNEEEKEALQVVERFGGCEDGESIEYDTHDILVLILMVSRHPEQGDLIYRVISYVMDSLAETTVVDDNPQFFTQMLDSIIESRSALAGLME